MCEYRKLTVNEIKLIKLSLNNNAEYLDNLYIYILMYLSSILFLHVILKIVILNLPIL